MPRSRRLDEEALSRAARRDLLIAGAAVLAAAALFSTVVWRPAALTDVVVRESRSMNPFVGVALAVAALGLLSLATGRRLAVMAAGSVVLLFGVVAFLSSTVGLDIGVHALFGRRPGYSGATAFVPTTSTVCLLLLGTAELLGARPRHWRARSARLGLLGMSVVALALIGGVADLLALAPPFTLARGAPMSPVTAVALAILGGAVSLTAWRSSGGSAAGRAPGWFPAVVGLGAACAAVVLWWSAAGQERTNVGRRVDLATRMMAGDLHSHLALLTARISAVAERGGLNGGASSPAWRAEAARLVLEAGSPVAAVGWVAGRGDARAGLVAGDPAALEAFAPALRSRGSWERVPGGGAVAAPAPAALRGDTVVALFVPSVPGAAGGAGVIAVVRPDSLLAQVLGGGPSRSFEYQLRLDAAVVAAGPRGQAGARSLARTLPVDPDAPRWTLTVWPLPAGLATMKTSLDELVLAVGLTVAGLLALMARLWQQARARALEVEIANRQLAADMVRHERLEAQLRQSQKMEAVGQLTGGIAHDLNNVLTIVSANAELMAASLPGDTPELRSELAQLRSAASRGATMVRQLLAFSRRKPLVPGPLDLVQVVNESSEMLRRLVPEHIVIRVTHAAARLPVMGDAGAVEQVLVNLVTNARDAMPGGGTLRLETRRTALAADRAAVLGVAHAGEHGCLVIADSGTGMDAATRERAFEPFFTTKEPGAGTGLGLSMVYALVQQLGGAIELDSAPQRGTVATVYLPAAAGEGMPAAAPRPPATLSGHEMILVVEDEAGIRRAAQRVLERHGYRVLLAENGEQGLAVYRQHAADIALVISDVVMPRMGGRELYETLRGDGARVRFLFASGYASPGTDDAPSLAGVPQIAKPWTIEELLRRVREVLDGNNDGEAMK